MVRCTSLALAVLVGCGLPTASGDGGSPIDVTAGEPSIPTTGARSTTVTIDARTPSGFARYTFGADGLSLVVSLPGFEQVITAHVANGVSTFESHAIDRGHLIDLTATADALRLSYDHRVLRVTSTAQAASIRPGAQMVDVDGNAVVMGDSAFDTGAFQALTDGLNAQLQRVSGAHATPALPPVGLSAYLPTLPHPAGSRPYGGSCSAAFAGVAAAFLACVAAAAVGAMAFGPFSGGAFALGLLGCGLGAGGALLAINFSPTCCPVMCGQQCCDNGETCFGPEQQQPTCLPPAYNICGAGGCPNADTCFTPIDQGLMRAPMCCRSLTAGGALICDSSGANPQFPTRNCCDPTDTCNVRTGACCHPGTSPMGQTCCTTSRYIAPDPQSNVPEQCCGPYEQPIASQCCAADHIVESMQGVVSVLTTECCEGGNASPKGPCVGASMNLAHIRSACCGGGTSCFHVQGTFATSSWGTPDQCCPPNPVWCDDHRTCCVAGDVCVPRQASADGRRYDCAPPFQTGPWPPTRRF